MTVFEALAALAREELAIVTEERYDELAGLHARREALMARLPAVAPPDGLVHLREAARVQALVTLALSQARDAVGLELGRIATTRRGVQGYADAACRPGQGRPAFSSAA